MDTSVTLNKVRNMLKAVSQKFRACALGAAVAAAMTTPTTALGWDFANVPLFWASGVNPNVMMMIDDSGSMHHMLISHRYQEYMNDQLMEKADGTVLTTPLVEGSAADDYDEKWYFCQTYDNSLRKCTGTLVQMPTGTFAVQTPGIATVKTVTETVVKNTRNWNTYKSSCSSNCLNGGDEFFYKTAHGFSNGDKVIYNCASRCPSGLVDGDEYIIINATADKFQLANSVGTVQAFSRSKGDTTSGDYDVTSYTTSTTTSTVKDFDYIYQSGFGTSIPGAYAVNEVLCDTRKKPGDADFIINNITITSNAHAYDLAQYAGLMVSKSSSGNVNDTCVRIRESISAKSPPAEGIAALNGHTPKDTPYPASSDAYSVVEGRWIMFLLNKHARSNIGANPSINFDTYFAVDPNDAVNNADDFKIVPKMNRIEAARESARKIVLDNYRKMQIGLASFTSSGGEINQVVGDPADPIGNKTTMIGTSDGTDFPFNAWDTARSDGAIGELRAQHSTPLASAQRTINNYFKGTVTSGITTAPTKYRCQKNYAVVMTDGEPNGDPDGWYLNNMAQEGYDTDLMTGTTNSGNGVGNDVTGKSWNDAKFPVQNIETFTIGLGLENNVLRSTPLVNSVAVAASYVNNAGFDNSLTLDHGLETGEAVNMVASGNAMCSGTDYSCMYYAVKVDATHLRLATSPANADACEKTYNTTNCVTIPAGAKTLSTGPGKALFAYTPDQLASSMSRVFAQILNLSASASAVSANSKQFGANSVVYQAGFNTEDWSGVLTAYNMSFDGNGKMRLARKWSTAPKTDIVAGVAVTTAGTMDSPSKLASQNAAGSKMFTWKDGSAHGAGGVALDAAGTGLASLPAWQQTGIGGTNGMKWLRGDVLPTGAAGFRDHSSTGYLGDVINADPLFVGPLNNGYGLCGTCSNAASYETYRASVASRTPMLFTGANDGMMHVIDADTGAEMMSFIPAGVYASAAQPNKLFLTTQDTYVGDNHRYFVDGASTAGDAQVGGGSGGWGTFVVGALGQGGKSIYAIDATDTSFTATDIKWEFKHAQMGYTYGKPIIGRLKDNNWYAIVPNGLDSAGGKASVFVIRLDNMATYEILETPLETSTNNGMMVVQAERDTNFYITKIYGGDMEGNIWKFDVSTSGSFPDGTRLFKATSPSAPTKQSITGGIRLGKHPNNLGTMVYFGTGKYFETVDGTYVSSGTGASVPHQDTFYAILDKSDGALVTRGDLVEQTFNASSGSIRTSSVNTVDYLGAGKKGWFIELLDGSSAKGERVVTTPVLSGGRIIFVSMVPEVGDKCIATGYSWLTELDALGGGQLPEKVLDTDGDGDIDGADSLTASLKMEGFLSEPTIIKGTGSDTKVMGSTSTSNSIQGVRETQGVSGTAGGSGRMSWQQLQ